MIKLNSLVVLLALSVGCSATKERLDFGKSVDARPFFVIVANPGGAVFMPTANDAWEERYGRAIGTGLDNVIENAMNVAQERLVGAFESKYQMGAYEIVTPREYSYWVLPGKRTIGEYVAIRIDGEERALVRLGQADVRRIESLEEVRWLIHHRVAMWQRSLKSGRG